ncbi:MULTISPECIES: bifunctional folylpolyglutamate synthase/dihydrofolate synthase [Brevibacillus]|uniref:Dihydrofolate synthase/folylpolyglutamate synthase n=1 Tax=Brevibacillus borstelensis AK1 TaxID=1300222 RepID=M8DH24_9BACL|nr:folylpolyglutamate synthase/dihydrofolate synthase family protein [Brevibacillus borstelensis]EMT52808.1 folylpolyglutamate synthase [Brevibacillus borstelensis AK1]KKX55770.1 folylpolyglutamate synthase [Brevibacillus borstelensis cifa_chp40]MBE5394598.1 bifunctional folylpolyglutamate synthase/dihydrofolate synthase [Brevibacillus borstelensis]MCC0565000.1 bifunctional folylpolyglutamate synthase/dihydrofolate synthase [Brevibacillus borstelensis]MCM3470603.1 bifunctional folylpolyglutama
MNAEGLEGYTKALDWLHGLLRFGQKPGLERMQWMLGQLGNPERRLAFIHVAGTNGKGSTCSYLSHMLMEAGYSVGMFTSPYLIDFRERIRYNGAMIPQADLVELVEQARVLVERCEAESGFGSPTEFEVITLIAILYFANVTRPAVVVWETGLGGRLDSTNVVFPIATVITNIGMDHMDVLGNSLPEIAREKAGIIKPGVPVITGERRAEVLAVLQEAADRSRSTLYRIGSHFDAEQLQERIGEQQIRYRSIFRRAESEYRLAMNGPHQAENAAVSLMTIDVLRNYLSYLLEEEEIVRGLQQTRWPGRLEVVSPRPMVMLDGAHNQEGIEALVASLNRLTTPNTRLHLLFSGLADKPLKRMAEALRGLQTNVETVRLTKFDFPRAAETGQLQEAFLAGGWEAARLDIVSDWRQFLASWVKDNRAANGDDWLVVCGSLYFIAQVRTFFPTTVEEAGE